MKIKRKIWQSKDIERDNKANYKLGNKEQKKTKDEQELLKKIDKENGKKAENSIPEMQNNNNKKENKRRSGN